MLQKRTLKDPPAHREMIESLESRSKAEECSFNTLFGSFQGHRIFAGRKVAEKIRSRPTTQPISTTWMSGRISGLWQSMTSFPAETKRRVQVLS
jgi:hypothetical protein